MTLDGPFPVRIQQPPGLTGHSHVGPASLGPLIPHNSASGLQETLSSKAAESPHPQTHLSEGNTACPHLCGKSCL